MKFLFFFPGTFLHELAHYIGALLMGSAEGFSVFPRVEGRQFVFGSVKSRTRYKVLSSFIAAAPLIWWVLLLLILTHFGAITFDGHMPSLNITLITARIECFTPGDLFPVWLFIQLVWAGRLSTTDLRNFFAGFLSISGAIVMTAAAGLIYLFRNVS